jgi:hypothetical protein
VPYKIVFEEEKYIFVTEEDKAEWRTFSFKREHDAWVNLDELPEEIRKRAEEALEEYLLSQH